MVNWDLLANPYNWIVVISMLLIGIFLISLLPEPVGLLPGLAL